jgi:hypothetical protein
VKKIQRLVIVAIGLLLLPAVARAQQATAPAEPGGSEAAQQNAPPAAQRVQDDAQRLAKRYGFGVIGGGAIDPELIDVGAHATIGRIFSDAISFRPGVELGVGEVTTLFAINLDVLYTFERDSAEAPAWIPFVGAGPQFALSHRGFATDETDHVDVGGVPIEGRNRFDFSDTDFENGVNFIVGMRKQRKFFEMRANAWGVSSVRLVAGFNF